MSDSLHDVISAALSEAASTSGGAQRVSLLRAVQPPQLAAVRPSPPAAPAQLPTGSTPLGRSGLRMAFWLCGLQDVARERQGRGEELSQREASLLALASEDFAAIRPAVIGMAVEQLKAVVDRCGRRDAGTDGWTQDEMELFALATVGSLSARACELLREGGADAALSLFGGNTSMQEPLAIYQQVFSTVVGVAESFCAFVPAGAAVLRRMIEALGSEVERI